MKERNGDKGKYSQNFSIFISAHMKKTELETKMVHSVVLKKIKDVEVETPHSLRPR